MRTLACVALLALGSFVTLGTGCAAPADGEGGSSSTDALSTVEALACKKPTVVTTPQLAADGPVYGSAHTTLAGCVAGGAGETGAAVVERATAILTDTQRLAAVKNASGAAVFTTFKAGPASGELATGLSQDIDVTLAMDHAPTTRLHIEQQKLSNGSYAVKVTNATALTAALGFLDVTVVRSRDLELNLSLKPEANGISVSGSADILLQQGKDQAPNASLLVSDLFEWLSGELTSTTP